MLACPCTVDDQRFEDTVTSTVAEWDPSVYIASVDAQIRDDVATVSLALRGPRPPEPAWRLAEMLSRERGVKVIVNVTFVLASEDQAVATP